MGHNVALLTLEVAAPHASEQFFACENLPDDGMRQFGRSNTHCSELSAAILFIDVVVNSLVKLSLFAVQWCMAARGTQHRVSVGPLCWRLPLCWLTSESTRR